MNDKKEKYQLKNLTIPDFLYEDNRLSALQLKICAFIYSYNGDRFYFCNEDLAKMFNVHPRSISRAMSTLEDYGYINLDQKAKSGGGQLRFVQKTYDLQAKKRTEGNFTEVSSSAQTKKSNFTGVSTSNFTNLSSSINKEVKDNNLKEEKEIYKEKESYSSLICLQENSLLQEVSGKYEVPLEFVRVIADRLENYVSANGKRYKNYRSALMNWVSREKERKIESFKGKKRYGFTDLSKGET